MNSNVFIHSKYDEKSHIIKIVYMLIPFLLYGIYKNGISLYNLHSISFLSIFKPLLFTSISIVVSILFSKIYKEKILSYKLLTNIFISLVTFPSSNIFIFILLLLVTNFIMRLVKLNGVCIYMILYSMLLMIFHKYTYLNIFESSYETNYAFLDLFLGKAPGGLSDTMLLFILISFIILLVSFEYKKEIPIISLVLYYIVVLTIGFINNNLDSNLLLNPNVLFGVVFISTITIYTPYTRGGNILYGLLLGILLIIFSFIDINIGVYISILLLSFLSKYLDKIITH